MGRRLIDMTKEELEAACAGLRPPEPRWALDVSAPRGQARPEDWRALRPSSLDRRAMSYRRLCLIGEIGITTLGELDQWANANASRASGDGLDHWDAAAFRKAIRKAIRKFRRDREPKGRPPREAAPRRRPDLPGQMTFWAER